MAKDNYKLMVAGGHAMTGAIQQDADQIEATLTHLSEDNLITLELAVGKLHASILKLQAQHIHAADAREVAHG